MNQISCTARIRGASRYHSPALRVRVPERVTWRIPHGRLIPWGPPYIIQISYANSLINNAGTERFIIPRYHRRLNTADLHANSPKDGASRPSRHHQERGNVSSSQHPERRTERVRAFISRHIMRRASERERARNGKRPIISCRQCRCNKVAVEYAA